MKRQQLEKLKGKKIIGNYGGGRKGRGGDAGQGQSKDAQGERVPIAVKLIKGLGPK